MKYGTIAFLAFVLGLLLVTSRAGAAVIRPADLYKQALQFQQAAEQNLQLELSLLPDFSTNKVTAIGESEFVLCSEVDWLAPGELPRSESEGVCQFEKGEFGEVVRDQNGLYWLNLLDLPLSPDDLIEFVVVGADVREQDLADLQAAPSHLPLRWEIENLPKDIRIPINLWRLETNLMITPLLTEQLVCEVGGGLVLSGKTVISNINDKRSYQTFVNDATVGSLLTELMVTYLDFPAHLPGDNLPGFVGFAAKKRELWFKTKVVSGQAPNIDASGQFEATLIGLQSESACLSSTNRDTENAISLETIRLGPQDVLTITLPDIQILEILPPPSQPAEANTLVYRGPAQFNLKISYRPTSGMVIKQSPFIVHAALAPIETFLDKTESPYWVFYLIFSALLFIIAAVILRKFSQKLDWGVAFIWFGVGLLLLYWTPAVSSLLLLAILVFIPHFNFRHGGHLSVAFIILVAVLLDNLLLVTYPNTFGREMQPVTIYTPYILLSMLLISIGIIYVQWPTVLNTSANAQRSSYIYLPAATMLLLTLSTYEVINQSFIPLLIIISIVFGIERYSHYKQNEPIPITDDIAPATSPQEDSAAESVIDQPEEARGVELPGCNLLFLIKGREILIYRKQKGVESKISTSRPSEDGPGAAEQPQTFWPVWLEGLKSISKQPFVILGTIIVALIALSSVSSSLNGLPFTLLTLFAILLLFTIMYDAIPTNLGYLKAFIFVLPLLLIFFLGIGTINVALPVTGRGPIETILFLNQLEALLIGRTIFYLSIPLFIGLYLEFQRQKEQSDGKKTVQEFLGQPKSIVSLVTVILSTLAPTLFEQFTNQEVIATFADIIEQLLIVSGG